MADILQTGELKRTQHPALSKPVDKAFEVVASLRKRFDALPTQRKTWFLASVIFLVAAVAAMAWYMQRPDERVLFTGLEVRDAQQVGQELAAAGIPYETSADGSGVMVGAEMLDKARMAIAAKGMPQSGRLGFELFDKPNWVGSEFDERVNYQRALEGELEHTIGTISAVRSARVHLVLPQQSLFSGDPRPAKASVVLKLKRASISQEETEAIRSLVAGSVENLSSEQVTLVDADGRVSMKPRSRDAIAVDLEQGLEEKLVTMLEPLAGRDSVRATVNVSYEEDSQEKTDEVYDPTQVVAVSLQKSDQSANQSPRSQGIPGTASNSPAAAPAGGAAGSQASVLGVPPLLQKEAQPVYPQASAGGQTLHQENGSYAITRHVIHSEAGPGRIRRVSTAIVINDRAVIDHGNTPVWKPRSAEEMRRMEQLAQAAVGFDAKRGDQVIVENLSFSSNAPEVKATGVQKALEAAKAAFGSQPGLVRTLMLGLCGVLLVMCVLKPVAQQVNAILKEPLLLAEPMRTKDFVLEPQNMRGDDKRPDASRLASSQQPAIFDHVSEHIRREPVQSTRLLEAWIGNDGNGATS